MGIVVAILIYILILLLTAKLSIYSLGKGTFKNEIFTKLMVSLYDLSVSIIPKGIYYKIPPQLQAPALEIEGNTYYFFGNIGKLGYYSDMKIIKGKETNLYLVIWKDLNIEHQEFLVQYPSGKEEIWNTKINLIQKSVNKSIYQVSPYIFNEVGKVRVKIFNSQEGMLFEIGVTDNSY